MANIFNAALLGKTISPDLERVLASPQRPIYVSNAFRQQPDDSANGWVISFGPFRIVKKRRILERHGAPVHIGSRAFDILVHLLEHHGQVASHRTLLAAVWPDTVVEEGSLRFQITRLRKALGNGAASYEYITNIPGRGYCFTASISRQDERERVQRSAAIRPNPFLLASPPCHTPSPTADIVNRPAAQPPIERAKAALALVALGSDAQAITEICSKLDALAFETELVATQLRALLCREAIADPPGRRPR
jgi:DNA-binding winged helix-turn-helix (wHTH) protein